MRTMIPLLITTFLQSCFWDTSTPNIKTGQLIEIIQLNKSVKEAIEKYGEQTDFTQGIVCGTDTAWHTNRFYFSNGIVIISTTIEGSEPDNNLTKSKIEEIGILYPANATTDKGINLKNDSLSKIIKTYGKPAKKETNKNSIILHYFSQGISFDCDRNVESIKRIAIYKKGGYPDFYYWAK